MVCHGFADAWVLLFDVVQERSLKLLVPDPCLHEELVINLCLLHHLVNHLARRIIGVAGSRVLHGFQRELTGDLVDLQSLLLV